MYLEAEEAVLLNQEYDRDEKLKTMPILELSGGY